MPTLRIIDRSKDPGRSPSAYEEEYLLVDRTSRDLVREMPQALFDAAQQALQGKVAREFLKSQIEVGTGVHKTAREAGAELANLRQTVAKLAGEHGLGPHRRLRLTRSRAGAPRSRPSATAIRRSPATSPASAAASSFAACTSTSASGTTSSGSIS
jgi:hypothetical protein